MGGADRQILYLLRALLTRGYEARLVAMTPLKEMGLLAVSEGLPITSLDMRKGPADWHAVRRLVALLKEWRPHLLTTFIYHANILGRVAGRWADVPLIVTSIRSERNGSAARDRLMRLTNWMDQCCTTNSQEVAQSLWKRGLLQMSKVRVIPNGVDIAAVSAPAEDRARIRAELGAAEPDFVWLAVGRLAPQKDYPTLLEAFPPLASAGARLLIAGRGELEEALQRRASELGIASRVTFLGVRHDIAALLAAADGFVLSSAWEGMPNVVMEALAAGTPVVATLVGGVSELVKDDSSGLLVPAGNPPALSRAMERLMSLPSEERRDMGLRGRAHVTAHYSLEAMAERWMALYEELLKGKALPIA
jgi:glycosyltransferase involved in cell wall biosynthesis